jgi:ubiquinone/menaquinone biosynthesis C-methylase UbiE
MSNSIETKYNNWHEGLGKKESTESVFKSQWYISVDQLLPKEFDGKILEIGCGRGDFSIYLAQRYPTATVIGTDFSNYAVESANSKIPLMVENLTFKTEDAQNLSFKDSEFDIIISCETLEHVTDQNKMLGEINRLLKKGGHYFVTTENYFNAMILSWVKTWISGKPFDSGSGLQPNENFMLFFLTKRKFVKVGLSKTKTLSNHIQWLLLPRLNQRGLCTENVDDTFFKKLLKPFGRHFTYYGTK